MNPRRLVHRPELSIRRPAFVALLAIQLSANRARAAFGGDDPRAVHPRRVVANVLIVAALESSDPVVLLVLVKRNDLAFHRGAANTWVQ